MITYRVSLDGRIWKNFEFNSFEEADAFISEQIKDDTQCALAGSMWGIHSQTISLVITRVHPKSRT